MSVRTNVERLDDAALQRRQLGGDPRARAVLAQRYMPLVRRLALRYRDRGEPLEELVQVGSVGLVKALQHWDPDRGTALSSYAVPTILGELRRHFRDHTWLVRPPRSLQDLALAVYGASGRVIAGGTHAQLVADLAAALKRDELQIREALMAIAGRYAAFRTLTNADGEEEGAPLEAGVDDDAGYARVEQTLLLEDLLTALDDRAREVVRLAYGEDLVQSEIAKRMGCSQMHVSRILRRSLERMRLHAAIASQAA
jgi:RNA polymerase sigma-B factor